VLGQQYKAVVCIYIYIYIYIHTVISTTTLQLVTIYNIQLHVSAVYVVHHQIVNKFFGQPDDGLHTGPKYVIVYYISLLSVILLCS